MLMTIMELILLEISKEKILVVTKLVVHKQIYFMFKYLRNER